MKLGYAIGVHRRLGPRPIITMLVNGASASTAQAGDLISFLVSGEGTAPFSPVFSQANSVSLPSGGVYEVLDEATGVVTITGTDAAGNSASFSLTILAVIEPLTVGAVASVSEIVDPAGSAVAVQLAGAVSGGTSPYTYSTTSGYTITGSILYIPVTAPIASTSVPFTVNDSGGLTATGSVSVLVSETAYSIDGGVITFINPDPDPAATFAGTITDPTVGEVAFSFTGADVPTAEGVGYLASAPRVLNNDEDTSANVTEGDTITVQLDAIVVKIGTPNPTITTTLRDVATDTVLASAVGSTITAPSGLVEGSNVRIAQNAGANTVYSASMVVGAVAATGITWAAADQQFKAGADRNSETFTINLAGAQTGDTLLYALGNDQDHNISSLDGGVASTNIQFLNGGAASQRSNLHTVPIAQNYAGNGVLTSTITGGFLNTKFTFAGHWFRGGAIAARTSGDGTTTLTVAVTKAGSLITVYGCGNTNALGVASSPVGVNAVRTTLVNVSGEGEESVNMTEFFDPPVGNVTFTFTKDANVAIFVNVVEPI